jgi:hypothetical protein
MIERRHSQPRKGERLVGYRPLAGLPRDQAGRLLLVYQFVSTVGREGERLADSATAEERARHAALTRELGDHCARPEPRARRGGVKAEQANLL